jgi:RNA polymerase sigma factor (sigma-70 family)
LERDSTRDLLKRVRAGQKDSGTALNVLAERYRGRIRKLLKNRLPRDVDSQEGSDIADDVVVKFLRAITVPGEDIKDPNAFALKILANAVVDAHRRSSRQTGAEQRHSHDSEQFLENFPEVPEFELQESLNNLLQKCAGLLTPKERQVFLLRHCPTQPLSMIEIAERLDVSRQRVYNIMNQVLPKLRKASVFLQEGRDD